MPLGDAIARLSSSSFPDCFHASSAGVLPIGRGAVVAWRLVGGGPGRLRAGARRHFRFGLGSRLQVSETQNCVISAAHTMIRDVELPYDCVPP